MRTAIRSWLWTRRSCRELSKSFEAEASAWCQVRWLTTKWEAAAGKSAAPTALARSRMGTQRSRAGLTYVAPPALGREM